METRKRPAQKVNPATRLAWMRGHLRDDEGQTLVETAMSLIILLTFLFGIWEVCLAMYSYHFISEAAREGARYAIVRGSSTPPVGGGTPAACAAPGPPTCIAQTADIQTYVKYLGFPGINPGWMTVTPTWSAYANGQTCPTSPFPCNSPGNLVTVRVTYNFPLNVPFVPAHTFAITSQSAMIIAQ
jgi:Flp pilus assembly protein TadG